MPSPHQPVIDAALEAFKNGRLVAIPTETVYGLAAPIYNEGALKKVFSIKERPAFDPLIVHVHKIDQARELVRNWPEIATHLAETFWPGPLTLVLEKSDTVSDLITSGLSTVGIRMPDHPLALAMIEHLGEPVAAPSANKFGKTSPTTADHVRREFLDDEVYVIEGGPAPVGVESTILKIDLSSAGRWQLHLLRPGMITLDHLTKELDSADFEYDIVKAFENAEAPGGMKNHYMPKIPLVLVPESDRGKNLLSICSKALDAPFSAPKELALDEDPRLAARELYGKMRELSDTSADCLFFFVGDRHAEPLWEAVMNRLGRAASVDLSNT